MACLGLVATAQAQIGVNTTNAFSTLPPAAEWSTLSAAGGGANPVDATTLDSFVQTNVAANITASLFPTNIAAPVQLGIAQWTSFGSGYLVTRATGNAYTILMATIRNTTAGNLANLGIVFDQTLPSPLNSEDPGLAGLRAYYSLTGDASSWTFIPELQSSVAGQRSAALSLGTWAANSLLYIMFIDDNGNGATDGSFAIDNFGVVGTISQPAITNQPKSTNVIVAQTIRLTVGASGLGLSYQWFKDGAPIDGGANPTATQSTLVITNAQPGDAGVYRVTVSNPAGGAVSDNATVSVGDDHIPPKMLLLRLVTGSTDTFRLTVDEPLCFDPVACGDANAQYAFNWIFGEVGGSPTFPDSITENGTNYDFVVTSIAINPNAKYYLTPDPTGFGIKDRFGNLMTNLPPATGYQSITSSPVVIFATDIEDSEIHSVAGADTMLGTATSASVDNDDGGIAQALLRFNNLIGPGATQIPQGAVIVEAILTLNQVDPGDIVNFNRMLTDWSQATVTWNSMVNGVTADGVEAATAVDATTTANLPNGNITINVTASVQAWANGQVNYGWALLPTGGGGWDFATVESATPPSLAVIYTVPPCTTMPAFTVQPAPANPIEGTSFTLTASLTGACNATYQWTKDNVNIPGATGSSYTSTAVLGAGGSGGNYRLRVTNPNGTVTSNPALVTVVPDTTRPVLLHATASSPTTVTLLISKQLSTAGTYSFNPAVAGVSASFVNGANNATVTVTSAARSLTTPYRLTIAGAKDNRASQNLINPDPTIVDLTGVSSVLAWAEGGNWNYATNTQDANPNWKTGTFGPEWLLGQQFFGFEDSATLTNGLPIQPDPIKTPLQPNNNTNTPDNFVTAYFVRQVTLPALEANTAFAISFYIDDGAIFYLDGVEIGRYQMPAGAVTFTTRSTGGNGEAVLQTRLFSASAGIHRLAVEVHQAGTTSSDVVFGLEINKVTLPSKLAIVNSQGTNIVSWTADNGWGLSSALNVDGTYNPVASNPVRSFRVPPAAQTNRTFYRLHYTP